MEQQKISREVKIPPSRLSYPCLNPERPRLNTMSDNPVHEWSADFLMDPLSKGCARLEAEFAAITNEFVAKYRRDPKHPLTLKDVGEWANQDRTRANPTAIVGLKRLTARQTREGKERDFPPPQLLDGEGNPMNFSAFYAGCFVRGVINVREYAHKKDGKIISCGLTIDLRAVQFVRDGDQLGGGTRDYAAYLLESDDDEEELVSATPAKAGLRL